MTRNGKIARLPKSIREELNRRLEEGATAVSLVDWLNRAPEVQALVQSQFGGHPIREQNLSQWKKGGYQDWLRHQEALELAGQLYEQAEEMKKAMTVADGQEQMPMNEVLSLWLSARYALATKEIVAATDGEGWKLLRQMCGDVAKMRRIEQQSERLVQQAQKLRLEEEKVEVRRTAVEIARERWEAVRPPEPVPPPSPECEWDAEVDAMNYSEFQEWFAEQPNEEKIAWVQRPWNWHRIRPLTEAEREAHRRRILGRDPDPEEVA